MNSDDYKFKGFEISTTQGKKYDAILKHRKTGKPKRVPFGSIDHEHFKDKALGLYSHLDHNDLKRRLAYRKRHGANDYHKVKFSPAFFSWRFLW